MFSALFLKRFAMSTHWADTGDVLGDGGASKASVTLSSVTARGGGAVRASVA